MQSGAGRGTVTVVRCFEANTFVTSVRGEDVMGRVLVMDGGGSIHTALMAT